MEKIDINQLPLYSKWPARIVGLDVFKPFEKTRQEIDREFNVEKWGGVLKQVAAASSSWGVNEADNFFLDSDLESVICIKDDLYVTTLAETHQRFVDEIAKRLADFLPSVSVAELGAGYGSVMLNLAKKGVFKDAVLFAAEYTASGIQCLDILASHEGIAVHSGHCDFNRPMMCDIDVPQGSLIYTCMAAHYVPLLTDAFVDDLSRMNPKVVVHFEPCLQHYDDTLLGLLRKAYLGLNGYNMNLLQLLKLREKKGDIKIVREEPCFFGSNCLLPTSLVAWVPVNRSGK